MILNLIGEPNMDSTVDMLYSMVEENYKRLSSIVEGMSQNEIDYKGQIKNIMRMASGGYGIKKVKL